ncbi:winged helix-turn-helix domain-containing protein [Paenibacillus sp. 481]|uniref:winged helix-turn-helix domain-containing protein n=1 Tax=Paenibacillus sp. 481 TaxID=2835869 RepID=UPI003FA77BB7|nr:winged helix-turn-helix domain-containing protein [Paenibacillus sp. 481]
MTVQLGSHVYIDFGRHLIQKHDTTISLSPTELRLLCRLSMSLNQVVPIKTLIAHTWVVDAEQVSSHQLHVYIGKVRKKLEDNPCQPEYILNVQNVGYVLCSQHQNT